MRDSPKKIALGVALGTSLNFLPMPFVSIPISFILAKIVRVNATAAVFAVIILKWAVPFFFTFNYYLGRHLLGVSPIKNIGQNIELVNLAGIVFWLKGLGVPFLLGSAINSLVAGVVTYYAVSTFLYSRLKNKTCNNKLTNGREPVR